MMGEAINALRGHLAEYGVTAPQGPAHVGRLARPVEDPGSGLPEPVRELDGLLLAQIAELDAKIDSLGKELSACARQDEMVGRLMTIPGVGPTTAMALQAFAPPMESFQRDLRRLLITGAKTVVRWATRRGATADPWPAKMLVAVALANRMARIAWVLTTM